MVEASVTLNGKGQVTGYECNLISGGGIWPTAGHSRTFTSSASPT